jgi:hypothetical protein
MVIGIRISGHSKSAARENIRRLFYFANNPQEGRSYESRGYEQVRCALLGLGIVPIPTSALFV